MNIAIVSSSFRKEVSENLEKNCLKTLKEKGIKDSQIKLFKVPGSWEIPLLVKKLAKSKKYDAIITFGAIVKGDTYHFEQIANELSRALMQICLEFEIPVIFEVLAVYDLKDALKRATRIKENEQRSSGEQNKGIEAALTALEMIKIIKNT